MAPEYGATMGFFPVDAETLAYLRFTNRDAGLVALVEAYTKEQGLFRTDATPDPVYADTLELDLGTVMPSLAGPKRPQDRVELPDVKKNFHAGFPRAREERAGARSTAKPSTIGSGAVVIAAITSCTNTSNPSVMLAAGLVAKKAVERGLTVKPWVKTSLAPGSKVVMDYYRAAGLLPYLEQLEFHLVGFGCTTCIGNSGPLPEAGGASGAEGGPGGGRGAERQPQLRRPHQPAGQGQLPGVAAAGGGLRAGRHGGCGSGERPAGRRCRGQAGLPARHLAIQRRRSGAVRAAIDPRHVPSTNTRRSSTATPTGRPCRVPPASLTNGTSAPPTSRSRRTSRRWWTPAAPFSDLAGLRVLAMLGDSVTTDHISPAGSIAKDSPAGHYLIAQGVQPKDFNSYGARRGNHEVMVRGTLANIRLRNQLAPGTEGGWTVHLPDGEQMSIYEPPCDTGGRRGAADRGRQGIRLRLLARLGGQGRAAAGREGGDRRELRAHPPHQPGRHGRAAAAVPAGETAPSLGLTGKETYHIEGIPAALGGGAKKPTVRAVAADGAERRFQCDRSRGYAAGSRILPQRRDSAVRAEAVGGAAGLKFPRLGGVVGQTIGFCRLLERAFGPRNFMKYLGRCGAGSPEATCGPLAIGPRGRLTIAAQDTILPHTEPRA